MNGRPHVLQNKLLQAALVGLFPYTVHDMAAALLADHDLRKFFLVLVQQFPLGLIVIVPVDFRAVVGELIPVDDTDVSNIQLLFVAIDKSLFPYAVVRRDGEQVKGGIPLPKVGGLQHAFDGIDHNAGGPCVGAVEGVAEGFDELVDPSRDGKGVVADAVGLSSRNILPARKAHVPVAPDAVPVFLKQLRKQGGIALGDHLVYRVAQGRHDVVYQHILIKHRNVGVAGHRPLHQEVPDLRQLFLHCFFVGIAIQMLFPPLEGDLSRQYFQKFVHRFQKRGPDLIVLRPVRNTVQYPEQLSEIFHDLIGDLYGRVIAGQLR